MISAAALLASIGRTCDSPLRTFLILYALLITTNISVCIYQYRQPTQANDNGRHGNGEEGRGLTRTGQFVKSLSESTDFFTIIAYVLGNIWISGAKTCSTTAPALYFTSLAWVIWGYVLLLLPIVALACIVMCLPCFIIFFNLFHAGFPQSTRQGATDDQINQLECIVFNRGKESNISVDDAKCSICLADYQDNEPLRRLRCLHHFHKECVDQWLGISATCPLCVQSILPTDRAAEEQV